MTFSISSLDAGSGRIAISPAPGRYGDYPGDLMRIAEWQPDLVVSMTELAELEKIRAQTLSQDLHARDIAWVHLPITDFGAPQGDTLKRWPAVSRRIRELLNGGGRVLVHCYGGCGRSGLVILRLLVEMGENGPEALDRLRQVRPCAVETEAQMRWALRL